MRFLLLLAVTALTCAALPAAASAQATAPTPPCPSFRVLHDDRIGSLSLPAGPYAISVGTPDALTCAQAADLFRQFLRDFDGRLHGGWRLDPATATFSRRGRSFSVTPLESPPTPSTPVVRPTTGGRCPGTFSVLHDDRIGRLSLPRGAYTITLIAHGRLTCARAARLFARFLRDYDGRLPGRWVVDPQSATFLRSSVNVGFRVAPAVNEVDPDTSTELPADGTACPGTFRVLHDDRIERLSVPRGRYRLIPLAGSSLRCSRVAKLFARFLDVGQDGLPRPWVVSESTGTFTRGRGSDAGFRIASAS